MNKNVVFCKGGTKEHSMPIDKVVIPDLWHVYRRLLTASMSTSNLTDKAVLKADAEDVLRTWHQAHALKDHIANGGNE